jgi:hypothetical protein
MWFDIAHDHVYSRGAFPLRSAKHRESLSYAWRIAEEDTKRTPTGAILFVLHAN